MENLSNTFEQAVDLARSGEKGEARLLFQEVVQAEPQNYRAWLWLSEITDDLEDQTATLEQAMKYIPVRQDGTKDLQAELRELYGFVTLTAIAAPAPKDELPADQDELHALSPVHPKGFNTDEIYQQAERLALLGKKKKALAAIRILIECDCVEERVWQLYSELTPSLAEMVHALEKIAEINPGNSSAKSHLEALRPNLQNPVRAGRYLEEWGERDQAIELYLAIAAQPASKGDQSEAQQALARLGYHQPGKKVALTSKRSNSIWGMARNLFTR